MRQGNRFVFILLLQVLRLQSHWLLVPRCFLLRMNPNQALGQQVEAARRRVSLLTAQSTGISISNGMNGVVLRTGCVGVSVLTCLWWVSDQVSWGRDRTEFLFIVTNTVRRRQEAVSTVTAAKRTHFNQRGPEQAPRPGQSLFPDPHPRKLGVGGATLTPSPVSMSGLAQTSMITAASTDKSTKDAIADTYPDPLSRLLSSLLARFTKRRSQKPPFPALLHDHTPFSLAHMSSDLSFHEMASFSATFLYFTRLLSLSLFLFFQSPLSTQLTTPRSSVPGSPDRASQVSLSLSFKISI